MAHCAGDPKAPGSQPPKGFDGLPCPPSQATYATAARCTIYVVLVVDVGTVIGYAEVPSRSGSTTRFPIPQPPPGLVALHYPPPGAGPPADHLERPRQPQPAPASRRGSPQGWPTRRFVPAWPKPLRSPPPAPQVTAFLTTCFIMFAEIGRVPARRFSAPAAPPRPPDVLQRMLANLWADMDTGGFSLALAADVLRFNGKLSSGAGTGWLACA